MSKREDRGPTAPVPQLPAPALGQWQPATGSHVPTGSPSPPGHRGPVLSTLTANSWWVCEPGGEISGPISGTAFVALIQTGRVQPDTFVSRDGSVFGQAMAVLGPELSLAGAIPAAGTPSPLSLAQPDGAPGDGVVFPLRGRQQLPGFLGSATPGHVPTPIPTQRYRPSRPVQIGEKDTLVCPHCWTVAPLEDLLYIAAHPELVGDPLLGNDAQQRFTPTGFAADGRAMDPGNMPTDELACPMCHLEVPRSLATMPSLYLSVVGAPGSGKSYYLGAMVWQLRRALVQHFGFTLTEPVPAMNLVLSGYEKKLFLNDAPNIYSAPNELIEKTQMGQAVYDKVSFHGQDTYFTKPYIFNLMPLPHNALRGEADEHGRNVIVYDNAGEHFQPGVESALAPTPHLARSHFVFFVFDPTGHPYFQTPAEASGAAGRAEHQDVILDEVARRIRRDLRLSPAERIKRLVVIVSKFDLWCDKLALTPREQPHVRGRQEAVLGLDLFHVLDVSYSLRHLLMRTCPEFVGAAESLAEEVEYLPASALGRPPMLADGRWYIKPSTIKPLWVEIPFLYALAHSGLLLAGGREPASAEKTALGRHVAGRIFCRFGNGEELEVPERHAGRTLHHPVTGKPFVVPNLV